MNRAIGCTATSASAWQSLAARQVTWTRLGNTMGYTNTESKRVEIRAAVERIDWQEPAELAAILNARQVITFLLGGRRPPVHRAAVAAFGRDAFGRELRLLGIESTSRQRYVLLDDGGYELVHLYTDHPTRERPAANKVVPVTATIRNQLGATLSGEIKCWMGRRVVEIETPDGNGTSAPFAPSASRCRLPTAECPLWTVSNDPVQHCGR
jgi:hypothetical protein